MDWNEKLQLIIDDVEQHLQLKEEPVDCERITRIAGCSYAFFQKVFSYMNGISFAEYIRYRKLTLAGYDLKSSQDRVVDISYRYGYDSPTSFTKAFLQFHGMTPTQARSKEALLQIYPRMQPTVKQGYTWTLEQEPKLPLIGVSKRLPRKDANKKIPEFWSECQKNGIYTKLIAMDSSAIKGLYGLFIEQTQTADELEYAIMVRSDQPAPAGFTAFTLPAVTWAKFDCYGPPPMSIQDGWSYLTKEWLSRYPFRHAPAPELEWYSDGVMYDETYHAQIWIPILEEETGNGTSGIL